MGVPRMEGAKVQGVGLGSGRYWETQEKRGFCRMIGKEDSRRMQLQSDGDDGAIMQDMAISGRVVGILKV